MTKRALISSVLISSFISLAACADHTYVAGDDTDLTADETEDERAPAAETLELDDEELENEAGQCGHDSFAASSVDKAVDIIFVIDNSGSMNQEIEAVEKNINENFAQIIEDSGIDYRVIMLTEHGTGKTDVCIDAPLADWSDESASCGTKPGINEGKFYHYSRNISSTNSLGAVLWSFEGKSDAKGLAKDGYHQWLRPEAFKIFIEVTDDGSHTGIFQDQQTVEGGKEVAANFDAALMEMSPEHFGTPEARNYRFYSIVGMAAKDENDPSQPWLPEDEIELKKCDTATGMTGTGYQALSQLTGGLRFPVCNVDDYDVLFNHVAQGIIEERRLGCEYDAPVVPEDKQLGSLYFDYTAGDASTPVAFEQVADESACTDDAFYVDGDVIRLCEQSCATVQADPGATVDFGAVCSDFIN